MKLFLGIVLPFLFMGCSATTKVDLDGDGYSEVDDCNDSDPTIHPNAPEVCDNVDNDCDGEADNDATDATTWYPDLDGDEFGDPLNPVDACEAPADHITDATDCDDSLAAVNPNATEVCDLTETDDDCDGLVNVFDDSIDMSTVNSYYPDADEDGYGDDAADVTLACKDPSTAELRMVTNNNDCDDSSAFAKPGGVEVCDGYDNDCDTETRENGLVLSVDRSGNRYDKTAELGSGTASAPAAYVAIGEESLYFCNGTFYTTIETAYSIDIYGIGSATNTSISASSSGTVLSVIGNGLTVNVSDIAIENGQASQPGLDYDSVKSGGGLYCKGTSDVNLTNVTLENNYSEVFGGGIYSEDCNITLEGGNILANQSDGLGGGLHMFGGTATLTNTTIANNSASEGGGVYVGSFIEVDDTLFTRDAVVNMTETTVHSNTANRGGGVFVELLGTVLCEGTSTSEAGIFDNVAGSGGGLYLVEGTFTANTCDFGADGSTMLPNSPSDVYIEAIDTTYTPGNDADLGCTESGC